MSVETKLTMGSSSWFSLKSAARPDGESMGLITGKKLAFSEVFLNIGVDASEFSHPYSNQFLRTNFGIPHCSTARVESFSSFLSWYEFPLFNALSLSRLFSYLLQSIFWVDVTMPMPIRICIFHVVYVCMCECVFEDATGYFVVRWGVVRVFSFTRLPNA